MPGMDPRLARALDARPTRTRVVGSDESPPMLQRLGQRFGSDERVTLRHWDQADSIVQVGRST